MFAAVHAPTMRTSRPIFRLIALMSGPVVAYGAFVAIPDLRTPDAGARSEHLQTDHAKLRYPVAPPIRVARGFDRPSHDWSPGHRGVDFHLAAGARVLAPADGSVTVAETIVDRGVLVIEHPNGLRSSFEPVTTGLSVGDSVYEGDPVAVVVGSQSGHCATTCLHWGVREGDHYVDPLTLVARPLIVLLPGRRE